MIDKKKKLVEVVFEKAKNELPNSSKTSIAFYLSTLFEEEYGFSKDGRTFVRYYKKLVEDNLDYMIDDITLDNMSLYSGYKNFNDFCNNYRKEPFVKKFGPINVTISESDEQNDNLSDQSSKLVVNITNSPVFNIPEFISKNKNSFGLMGILVAGGIFVSQKDNLPKEKQQVINQQSIEETSKPKQTTAVPKSNSVVTVIEKQVNHIVQNVNQKKVSEKECMYWKLDHYVAVLCNEDINVNQVIAIDEELLTSFRKINRVDTLTVNNALGKVWYDKSNNHVEFFTNFGIHPENGKTLKPVSKHIIEKYINN